MAIFNSSSGAALKDGVGTTVEGNSVNITTPVQGIKTQAEFDALPEEQQNKGLYVISDGEPSGGGTSAGEVYSTEEVRIGTWVDGKPLYRKCYLFTTQNIANLSTVTESSADIIQIPVESILNLVNIGGRYYRSNSSYSFVCPYGASNNYFFSNVYFGSELLTVFIKGTGGVAIDNISAYIFVEYTKTTDTAEVTS